MNTHNDDWLGFQDVHYDSNEIKIPDLKESVKEIVSKAFETAMRATRQSLKMLLIEGQGKVTNKLGAKGLESEMVGTLTEMQSFSGPINDKIDRSIDNQLGYIRIRTPIERLDGRVKEKLHNSTSKAIRYVVDSTNSTREKPEDVSEYIGAVKKIQVNQIYLTTNVQTDIDQKQEKINSSATTLTEKVVDNSDDIHDIIHSVRLALIIISNVMLLLTFIEFFLSLFDSTIVMN
ncbi:hypothetical protein AgCh_025987 [Apium graveolens]